MPKLRLLKISEIFLPLSFLIAGIPTFAQHSIYASGADANGPGGSISYTIGQIDYHTDNGNEYTIAQGIQQPYEIYAITGIDLKHIDLTFTIYPNPTVDFLTLKIENFKTGNFTVHLCDAQGKILFSRNIESSETSISMKDLSNAFYYVKVLKDSMEVKVFKVIKNN